ncbi:family 2 glycosyl transferase, partial [Streptacidiphilus monticola]
PLAALAALLRADRRRAVVAAWGAAAIGLLGTALAGTATVTPGPGQSPVAVWAGPTTLLAGIALLTAASIGADGARERVAAINFGWRQPVAALVLFAAAVAPVAAAGWWLVRGAAGPLRNGDGQLVPAFIAQQAGTVDQTRTLVLRIGDQGQVVSYQLVRGAGPTVGSAETANAAGPSTALARTVGDLVSGSGGDQSGELAGFGVQFVVVQKPVPAALADTLNATPGLTQVNQQAQASIWRLTQNTARAVIRTQGTPDVQVAAGPVDVDATVPAGGTGRVLRLADQADPSWHATLNGKDLTPTTVDGWAQGFQLPAEGGKLSVRYESGAAHTGWIAAQCLLALVLVVLALPGRGSRNDDDQPDVETESAAAAAPVVPGSRRARRLAANGEEAADGGDGSVAPGAPTGAASSDGADDGSGVYAATGAEAVAGAGDGGAWQAFGPAGGATADGPGAGAEVGAGAVSGAGFGDGAAFPAPTEPVWDAFAPTGAGAERSGAAATAADGYYADPQQPYYTGQPYYGEYDTGGQAAYQPYPQWDGSASAPADPADAPQGWYDAQGYWHSTQDGTAPGSGA